MVPVSYEVLDFQSYVPLSWHLASDTWFSNPGDKECMTASYQRLWFTLCPTFSLFHENYRCSVSLLNQSHLYPAHGDGVPGLGLAHRKGHPSGKKEACPFFAHHQQYNDTVGKCARMAPVAHPHTNVAVDADLGPVAETLDVPPRRSMMPGVPSRPPAFLLSGSFCSSSGWAR